MRHLKLEDKKKFEDYITKDSHLLSYFSFTNIFIWKELFEIFYIEIKGCLCVFFKDRIGIFMILPPLGKNKKEVISKCFEIMDRENLNKDISRIENVEEKDLDFYKNLGFQIRLKDREYICKRSDLVSLRGDRFKSKRNSYNYFLKNYKFQYLDYNQNFRKDCISLYRRWAEDKKRKFSDLIYQKMLEDNFSCLKVALENYKELNLIGRVIKIDPAPLKRCGVDNNLCGFSFGFSLNKDTFCILFEITDLKYKGISQFLFREFCRELVGSEYINIMDAWGLENLKRTKLSYYPVLEVPQYIVTR